MQKTLLFQTLCTQGAKTKPTPRGLEIEHCILRLSLLPLVSVETTFSPGSSISSCRKKCDETFLLGKLSFSAFLCAEKRSERQGLLIEVGCCVWKAAWDC